MALKLTPGRIAERFRGTPMFPALMLPVFPTLMLRPNHGGGLLPFTGRWRPKPRRLGAWQPPKIYGRIGSLEVRLARKKSEIRQAQRLRYKVFYEEMSAVPNALAMLSRRDEDTFDKVFDHLLVVDRGDETNGRSWRRSRVVGTYRVLRQEVADYYDGFYTQGEYDIQPLIEAKGRSYSFLELGRSCVLKPYRNRRTLELLWQGVWSYLRENGANVMIGCASFTGHRPEGACRGAELSAPYLARSGGLARQGTRASAHRHEHDARRGGQRTRRNQGAAALDQGLSQGWGLYRRRRGHRPSVWHNRCVRDYACRGDEYPLFRPFRRP